MSVLVWRGPHGFHKPPGQVLRTQLRPCAHIGRRAAVVVPQYVAFATVGECVGDRGGGGRLRLQLRWRSHH